MIGEFEKVVAMVCIQESRDKCGLWESGRNGVYAKATR